MVKALVQVDAAALYDDERSKLPDKSTKQEVLSETRRSILIQSRLHPPFRSTWQIIINFS